MRFIVMTNVVSSVAEAAAFLTYLVHFFMMTIDVFFYAEAGAHLLTHLMRFLILTFYKLNTQHNTHKQI